MVLGEALGTVVVGAALGVPIVFWSRSLVADLVEDVCLTSAW